MRIFPAIDLSGGRVVRLYQGDYDKMTVYGDDPVETAHGFMAAGADCLHTVDLDAAKSGGSDNFRSVRELCGIPGLFVEVGGGIRSRARIEDCLECGAGRVILGTAAVRDFDFTARMAAEYGDKIAVAWTPETAGSPFPAGRRNPISTASTFAAACGTRGSKPLSIRTFPATARKRARI